MIPRKAKEFLKPTADKLGISEDLVTAVTSLYWQQVRYNLSHPDNVTLSVADFGTFNIKPWKLEQFIVKYHRIVDNTELDTFQKFAAVKQLEKRKLIIDTLVAQLEELKLKKQLVKEKRYGKVDNNSLEK